MSAFKLNDEITFSTMTPDGLMSGTGRIIGVFPSGNSFWLHIMQPGGKVRLLFQGNAHIELRNIAAAA